MRKQLLLLLVLLSGCILENRSPDRCYHLWDPSQKDNCLVLVAVETKNMSKCDEITVSSLSEKCYALLIGGGLPVNSSTCAKLSGNLMDECFGRLAASSNDTSMCMRINSSYLRDSCLSGIAIAMERPEICDSISLNISRNTCKNQIYPNLAIQNGDTAFCRLIVTDTPESQQDAVDRCIFSVAEELNDTTLCNQIVNPFAKDLCKTGSIDPALCNQITESQGKQACLYVAAVYSKNPDACKNLPSVSLRDNCYTQVAKDTNNPSLCTYIATGVLRDQCMQIVKG